ncbi:3-dehydroquinate synthase II [Candidatus Bathyarchaeota archaeon]|nr:MAG: 3-dehydroquinate synthase II [Candidatus Bathyarchaeota archaeon]
MRVGADRMRELWIRIDPSLPVEEKKRLVGKTANLASAFLVEPEDVEVARTSGASIVVSRSEDSDILLVDSLKALKSAKRMNKEVCIYISIRDKGDEEKIVYAAEALADYVVADCPDWKVIPLENLIAAVHGKIKLMALASTAEEGRTALETLQIGVDGLVADTASTDEILKISDVVRKIKTREYEALSAERIRLQEAEILEVKPLESGARVCIDTCDLMREGEGMLVGCQSSGFFLVEAEVHKTPFVAPRPFRVNAGAIAMYILAPDNKTKYLSELEAGDEVLIVDREGRGRAACICRVKIEWRPMLLIKAECQGRVIKTILQNAETIRVMAKDGSKSVSELKPGDKVLVHVQRGGRHFGTLVKDEKVIER